MAIELSNPIPCNASGIGSETGLPSALPHEQRVTGAAGRCAAGQPRHLRRKAAILCARIAVPIQARLNIGEPGRARLQLARLETQQCVHEALQTILHGTSPYSYYGPQAAACERVVDAIVRLRAKQDRYGVGKENARPMDLIASLLDKYENGQLLELEVRLRGLIKGPLASAGDMIVAVMRELRDAVAAHPKCAENYETKRLSTRKGACRHLSEGMQEGKTHRDALQDTISRLLERPQPPGDDWTIREELAKELITALGANPRDIPLADDVADALGLARRRH